MKKGLILFLSISILLLLVIRAFYLHSDRLKEEKLWYVKHLHFEFSAKIDSPLVSGKRNALLFFHIVDGTVNRYLEHQLNEKLKHNGSLWFILNRPNGRLGTLTTDAKKYAVGDSIRVITDHNVIKIYRNKILVSEAEIAKSLIRRPF